MAQQAVPARGARLGRAVGTTGRRTAVSGAVLMLADGPPEGTGRPSPVMTAAVLPLARHLARAGHDDGLVVHGVRYRCRGWNGSAADPAEDAAWAVDEVVRRYGDIPVCLAGTGMGARAALLAAGRPGVNCVLALAPWLPAEAKNAPDPDPVKQLAGRRVLLVHGTNDERADPEQSYRYAQRVKKANRDVCRFEVHSDGHRLQQHRSEVRALAADFTLGSLFERGFSRPVEDALAAPPPLGLRMPLAVGFRAVPTGSRTGRLGRG
ncbi:prolyl oligopeptidase family serine peptidase [Streptomyces sp. F63]|uniref:prolyl oligopeptidase family serine peptidase n=1 Tax=Streptomyces sp. F63 TaxID=2824887 RepID=UPI001B382D45|nr:prolyl oligopeptidase family serine peptidase [Streptomyces sp. F63]MBQ0987356.1 prolyl oligopeptidase family serine peptidase [Streptomyces sp. F63]